MWRKLTFGLLFPLIFAGMSAAETLPTPINDTVSDFADLLSVTEEAELTAQLQEARATTGVHVVLATMDRIESYGAAGQSIESYAKKLFNTWGIGDSARNDGVLILIASDDRAMRIALGDGFNPVYDGLAQRVIDSDVLPLFRRDDYPAGIKAAVTGTIDRIARPFAKNTPPATLEPGFDWTRVFPFAIFGLVAGAIAVSLGRRQIGDLVTRFQACPSCGARSQSRSRVVDIAATKDAAGQGTQIVTCASCRRDHRTTFAISPLGSRTSSSGGGGFGGGGSSGGGASGRW